MSILRHSQSVSLAHRYWNNLWSHERNQAVYGFSSSPEGVGSNLRVEMEVEAHGAFDFRDLSLRVKALLDHKCLADEVPEFRNRPSTLENVAEYTSRALFAHDLRSARWRGITFWELDRYGCRIEPGGMAFRLRFRNLEVALRAPLDRESGLMVSRAGTEQMLAGIFKCFSAQKYESEFIWLENLFSSVRAEMPYATELIVDLGSHKLTTGVRASDNAPSRV